VPSAAALAGVGLETWPAGDHDMKSNSLGLSYLKSPRATFALRHPRAAVMTLIARQGLRHSRTVRRTALGLVGLGAGLGAAAVALPMLASRYLGR
jgi:hypothetical protein